MGKGRKPGTTESEPQFSREVPECPEHLDEAAREEWYRVVGDLHSSGVLTRVDRAVLAAYCSCYALWADAEAKIQKSGVLLKDKDAEKVYVNPYVHVRNNALRQMHAFASELGMSPASRSRLHVQPNAENDPLDVLLRGVI